MYLAAAISFVVACLVSLALTAAIRRFAPRIGLTDLPDANRKLHDRPMPLGGGVAVFLATVIVLGGTAMLPNPWGVRLQQDWREMLGFLLGCGCIVAVGLVDDRFGLRGRHKLLGQCAAALLLMSNGMVVQRIGLFGLQWDLGLLAVPFTLFWLVGAVNAVNLLDGMDGLATTLGIILSLTISVMAMIAGHPGVAMVALVFAGSLVGFLRYNFPPASIFLGDAGSMLIGLMVGALAIHASLKGPGTVLLAAPLAVLTIPIFDSAAAVVRRKLAGRSIYSTDRAHLHHQLMSRLGSSRKTLAVIGGFCCLAALAALATVSSRNDLIALVTAAGVVALFIATGLFGRAEGTILGVRLHRACRSLLSPLSSRKAAPQETVLRLQGCRRWELLWATLTESARKLDLSEISLDLNLPAIQEGYHATWQEPDPCDRAQCWRLELPLVIDSQPAGALVILGKSNGNPASHYLEQLVDLLEPFERDFRLLSAADAPRDAQADDDHGSARPQGRRSRTAAGSQAP